MSETSEAHPGSKRQFRYFPDFFVLTFAIILVGIGMSITRPFLSLFFTDIIHMSPLKLGIFTFMNGIGGIVASTWLGKLSDARTPKKTIIWISTICGALGYLSFIVIHGYWPLLIVSTILLGLGAAAYPQLFAYARESARLSMAGDATVAISTLRSFFSLAWVIGPLAGTWLLAAYNFNGLFSGTAVLFVAMLIVVVLRLQRRTVTAAPARSAAHPQNITLPQLLKRTDVWMTSISSTAVYTAMNMNGLYMPLLLTHTLHGPEHMVGWVVSLSAGLEIPIIIGVGMLAERVGKRPLMLVGSLFGILYYLGAALASHPWEMLVLQLFCATFVSIAVSIGMSYFQDFAPDAPGMVTTLYSNTSNFGAMAGSLLGGIVAQAFGFRSVYWLSLFLGVISFVFMLRRRQRSLNKPS